MEYRLGILLLVPFFLSGAPRDGTYRVNVAGKTGLAVTQVPRNGVYTRLRTCGKSERSNASGLSHGSKRAKSSSGSARTSEASDTSGLSDSFLNLLTFIKYSYQRPHEILHKADHAIRTSREAQVFASIVQGVLLQNNEQLALVNHKLEQDKLGLSSSEKQHIRDVMKYFRLWDEKERASVAFSEPFYVALYSVVYARVSSQDRVVAGSGNTHSALLAPHRLQVLLDERYNREERHYIDQLVKKQGK